MFTRTIRNKAIAIPVAAGVLVLSIASCRREPTGPDPLPVESRFNQSGESWSIVGDGLMSHVTSGGNPGGFVQTVDQVNGPSMFFVAPARFAGSRADAYGRLLTFDLTWTSGVDPNEEPDLVAAALHGAGMSIVAYLPVGPDGVWTTYSIRLDETGGWVHEGGSTPATATEIQQVLGSLQQLRIRGEYNEGQETTRLDNVVFGIQG